MTKFCTNCGELFENENAVVCTSCGKPASKNSYRGDTKGPKASETKCTASLSPTQTKSAFFAALLSFIWPGLGQVYNGKFWKGVFFFFAFLIGLVCFVLPGLAAWVWGVWSAYKDSEKMNTKELPYKEATVWEIIIFLYIPFILYVVFMIGYIVLLTMLIASSPVYM